MTLYLLWVFAMYFSPVIISEAQRVAPEEMFAAGHEKQKNEMTQEERKALRNATKERRRKKIVGKVVRPKFFSSRGSSCILCFSLIRHQVK